MNQSSKTTVARHPISPVGYKRVIVLTNDMSDQMIAKYAQNPDITVDVSRLQEIKRLPKTVAANIRTNAEAVVLDKITEMTGIIIAPKATYVQANKMKHFEGLFAPKSKVSVFGSLRTYGTAVSAGPLVTPKLAHGKCLSAPLSNNMDTAMLRLIETKNFHGPKIAQIMETRTPRATGKMKLQASGKKNQFVIGK